MKIGQKKLKKIISCGNKALQFLLKLYTIILWWWSRWKKLMSFLITIT